MFKSQIKELPIYKFNNFEKFGNVGHFVTTREYDSIANSLGGFNLSYKVNDVVENVTKNRQILAESLGITQNQLLIPVQTHSANSKIVTSENDTQLDHVDALITARPGICIAVMSADCVPILIYDVKNRVAAAIHAGWKGTVSLIVRKTIDKMVHSLGAEPKHMVAGIGPSICDKIYEVGNEVAEYFDHLPENEKSEIIKPHANPDKKYLNLQSANKIQLLEAGLLLENIEIANICTYTNSHIFYSARFSNNNCGRFASGIIIN